MMYVLAASPLAPWGQAAAIILAIYTFVSILIGLAFSAILMYGFAWVREKAELLKKLRPTIDSLNTTIDTPPGETLPATVPQNNKILQAVHTVQSVQVVQKAKDAQKQVENIDKKIEQGADRVADAVIEFRDRTVMVKGIVKAFFLPGLTKQKRRGAYLETAAPGPDGSVAPGGTYTAGETSNVAVAQPGQSDKVSDELVKPVRAG